MKKEEATIRIGLGKVGIVRIPDVAAEISKPRRHDADQRALFVIEEKCFTEYLRILIAVLDPHLVAHDENGQSAALAVFRKERAPSHGRDAEEIEGIGRDSDALQTLRAFACCVENVQRY